MGPTRRNGGAMDDVEGQVFELSTATLDGRSLRGQLP